METKVFAHTRNDYGKQDTSRTIPERSASHDKLYIMEVAKSHWCHLKLETLEANDVDYSLIGTSVLSLHSNLADRQIR